MTLRHLRRPLPTGPGPTAHPDLGRAFGALATATEPGRSQWSSTQILGSRQEIEILHAGSIYRLRVTSLGKLILTK